MTPPGNDTRMPPLAPVVDDLSAWIIAGTVSSARRPSRFESQGRTPAQGIQDGVDAERLGFRRVWLSERWNIKLAEVILAGVAARTTRLDVGTGAIVPSTRQAWSTAAFGATMQATFGERFILGLGRGQNDALDGMGIAPVTVTAMRDYIAIYRALWAGDTVSYDGPAGHFPQLRFTQTYTGAHPPIWLAGIARERGAALIAHACDGVLLPPMITPEATGKAVTRIRQACDRIGRDPASVRICAPVVTAPELDEEETAALTAGRLTTYLQLPGYGHLFASENGWETDAVDRVLADLHAGPGADDTVPLVARATSALRRMPKHWIRASAAIGSVEDCVTALQRFRDAGADEVATYGSTPGQNAALVRAWRQRRLPR